MASKKTTKKAPAAARKSKRSAAKDGKSIPLKTLVIAADDGKLYKIPEKDYKNPKYLLDIKDAGPVTGLLSMGTTLAFIPQSVGVGIGSVCYVVNLGSLRTDHAFGEAPSKK
jgi:hypothetical protein